MAKLPEAEAYGEAVEREREAMRGAIRACEEFGEGSPEERAARRALGEAKRELSEADEAYDAALALARTRSRGDAVEDALYERAEPYDGAEEE